MAGKGDSKFRTSAEDDADRRKARARKSVGRGRSRLAPRDAEQVDFSTFLRQNRRTRAAGIEPEEREAQLVQRARRRQDRLQMIAMKARQAVHRVALNENAQAASEGLPEVWSKETLKRAKNLVVTFLFWENVFEEHDLPNLADDGDQLDNIDLIVAERVTTSLVTTGSVYKLPWSAMPASLRDAIPEDEWREHPAIPLLDEEWAEEALVEAVRFVKSRPNLQVHRDFAEYAESRAGTDAEAGPEADSVDERELVDTSA